MNLLKISHGPPIITSLFLVLIFVKYLHTLYIFVDFKKSLYSSKNKNNKKAILLLRFEWIWIFK